MVRINEQRVTGQYGIVEQASMRKIIIGTITIFSLIIAGFVAFSLYQQVKPVAEGIKPAIISQPVPVDLPKDEIGQEIPEGFLTVAEGYSLRIFTRDTINPRVMIFDHEGRMVVSEPSAGRISVYEDGKRRTLLENMNRPHGLAFAGEYLYVAETGQVLRYRYDHASATVSERTSLLDLPSGGRHWTRTLGIGPDGYLYITVGSSCNICLEDDWRRTTMLRYDLSKQELQTYATGLRNAVYFAWQPGTERLFATEMARDWLGNALPPDELNVIEPGGNYGYPYCFSNNVTDPHFNQPARCADAKPSHFDFEAHEAPLGLDFYQGDLYVALHGSWNRTPPIGYEVIKLTEESDFRQRETIISGWLKANGTSTGRPAGVTTGPDGRLYISDDAADVIYVLTTL